MKKTEIDKLDSAGRAVTRLWLDSAIEVENLKKAIRDALDCLDKDDWTCENCGLDVRAGTSNAAYFLRQALKDGNK